MPYIIGNAYISSYSVELSIFFIVSSFLTVLIINKIQGSLSNFYAFFVTKSLSFMKTNSKIMIFTKIFAFTLLIFLLSPLASLFLWGAVVLKLEEDYPASVLLIQYTNQNLDFIQEFVSYSDSHLGGKSIFLVGTACWCFAIAGITIKLSKMKVNLSGIFFFFLGLGIFFAWKIIVLMDDSNVSFFGMTAIFFGLNAMVMIPLIFLKFERKTVSIYEVIKGLDKESIPNNKNYDNVESLINDQLGDPKYNVTQSEVLKLVTSCEKLDDMRKTAVGGGFLLYFKSLSKFKKNLIISLIYICALGVLVAYSLIIYYYGEIEQRNLGFLNLVMVGSTDIMLYLYQRVKRNVRPLEVCLLIMSNRIFLYAFGGDYWFIGYCCLYILLNLPMSYYIVDKNLPLSDYSVISTRQVVDLSRSPEFVTVTSTTLFIVLIVVLALADISGVPTKGFYMSDGKQFPFWAYGVSSIFFVFTFLVFLTSGRIYDRYSLKIKERVFYYVFSVKLDIYFITSIVAYLCVILIGGLCYAATNEPFPLIFCCFIPILYYLILMIHSNWRLNDYRFPADTQAINKKMQKCKEKIEAQTKRTKTLKPTQTIQVAEPKKTGQEDFENLLDLNKNEQKNPEQENNPEEVEIGPVDPEIWAKNGITQFFDWRAQNIPIWKAVLFNYLIPTDYKMIYAGY